MNDNSQELDRLIETLISTNNALADHLNGDSVDSVRSEQLARMICLASRASYSEFQAQLIEHNPGLSRCLPRLRDAHLKSVSLLENIPAKTDNTLEFLEAIDRRAQRFEDARTRAVVNAI